MQNTIEREIIIRAPQARIYAAIADPAQVVKWFPETLEGNYVPGQQAILGFGAHGRNSILITDAKPNYYFAYKWVPGSEHFIGDVLSVAHTLVEFRIDDLQDGSCKLTLIESGFEQLPAAIIDNCFKQNSQGWEFMLSRLLNLFAES